MRMPAARAIATMCMVWLVEPPVASRATIPLTTTFSSTILPSGIHSLPLPVRRVTCRAAAAVRASRSGASGWTNDEPGSCIPINSTTIWLVLAVP
ncbi:hypothetical protein D3C76_1298970 [compost metagenome]